MGDNSPWLTLIGGSDPGRPCRSTLISSRSSMASVDRLGLPGTRDLAAPRFKRCHQFGAPVSSPWHGPGELVGNIVLRATVLEHASCFVPITYDEKPDGCRGQARQAI